MRLRPFTDESVEQMHAFLAASHPRAAVVSPWARLPDALQRRIAAFVLRPLCAAFVRWDPMAVVRDGARALSFGLRLKRRCAMQFHIANDEGVAVCGPPMTPGSGIYEVDFSVKEMFSLLDNFCRADMGVVLDPMNPERNGSGIWWEAGDGDIYVASDMESISPKGAAGWLGNDNRVEEGLLPRWDKLGMAGIIVDTYRHRLGFTQHRQVLPFEMALPPDATLYFAIGWSGDTGGTVRVERLQRFAHETDGPVGQLLASLRSRPCAAAAAVRAYVRSAPGGVSPTVVAESVDALPPGSRRRAGALAAWARALPRERRRGGFPSDFAAEAVRSLRLRSSQEHLCMDMAEYLLDPWTCTPVEICSAVQNAHNSKNAWVDWGCLQSQLDRWVRILCWCCH